MKSIRRNSRSMMHEIEKHFHAFLYENRKSLSIEMRIDRIDSARINSMTKQKFDSTQEN